MARERRRVSREKMLISESMCSLLVSARLVRSPMSGSQSAPSKIARLAVGQMSSRRRATAGRARVDENLTVAREGGRAFSNVAVNGPGWKHSASTRYHSSLKG